MVAVSATLSVLPLAMAWAPAVGGGGGVGWLESWVELCLPFLAL